MASSDAEESPSAHKKRRLAEDVDEGVARKRSRGTHDLQINGVDRSSNGTHEHMENRTVAIPNRLNSQNEVGICL